MRIYDLSIVGDEYLCLFLEDEGYRDLLKNGGFRTTRVGRYNKYKVVALRAPYWNVQKAKINIVRAYMTCYPLKEVQYQMFEQNKIILPSYDQIFRCLTYFEPENVKVVIIGQDPYPNKEDACGLAFSVEHEKIPASLKNIFRELKSDLGYDFPKTGNLESWAKQGVLLLNSVLTVEEGKPTSHSNIGWEDYTTGIVSQILSNKTPVVIIGWGNYAKKKIEKLREWDLIHDQALILTGGHPSPLNTKNDFLGGQYFSKANDWLKAHGQTEINWKL